MDEARHIRPPVLQGLVPSGLDGRLALLVRVRWLFALGAFLYAGAAIWVLGASPMGGALPAPVFLAALPLIVLAQNVFVAWSAGAPARRGLAVLASVAGDLVTVTIGLHGTGGLASWLWSLYPLITLETAYLTRSPRATGLTAVAGICAFTLVPLFERLAWLGTVETAFTVEEQQRPAAYAIAKIAWLALVNAGAMVAGLSALVALERAQRALEVAYGRLSRQYADLRALDRLKDNFLSVVSHELRTPLTIASGYAELAEEDPGLTPEGRTYLAASTAAISGLAANVDLMIAYATLADGTRALRLEPVAVGELLEQVFETREAGCREAGVVLLREEVPDAVQVIGDGSRLAAALGELVKNACHATPRGGTVGLGVRVAASEVAFEVWDTGPGVPAGVRSRLGEPFQQPDAVLTEHTPGLGLGLAFANLVARRHRGTLTIGDRPGGGAAVRLALPLAQPSGAGVGPSYPYFTRIPSARSGA